MQGINSSQTTLSHSQSDFKSDPVPSSGPTVETKQSIKTCTSEALEQVNTPPAKAGGFGLRLKAGLIGHSADCLLRPLENHHLALTEFDS